MTPHDAERLHVLLGYACNNNCLFCMEEDRVTRAQRILDVPPETVHELMRRHAEEAGAEEAGAEEAGAEEAGAEEAGAKGSGPSARPSARHKMEVMFTSGEPLLNRHFLRYVREARALGYETIGVITNGRLFAYEKYARRALTAGLNHIVVSVHGADAKHHDAQTRTHASYAQTVLGLRTLARLKREFDFRLHTSTVVNRRNVERLYEVWASLQGLHIDQHVFNVIQPVGRAEVHFDRLVARFTDVVSAFAGMLERIGDEPSRAYLLDVPWCVSEGLPDEARGFVERYQYYEHEDGLDDALRFSEHGECAAPGTTLTLPGRDGERDGAELRRLTRRRLDGTRKSKRDECGRCRHEPVCDGVWNVYLDAWGWDEFQPVEVQVGAERSE